MARPKVKPASQGGKPEGLIRQYYPSGKLKEEIYYRQGKPEGISKQYYENGQLKTEANYKKGLLDGYFKNLFSQWSARNHL